MIRMALESLHTLISKPRKSLDRPPRVGVKGQQHFQQDHVQQLQSFCCALKVNDMSLTA